MRPIVVKQWTGTYNKTTTVLIAQQFRAYSIAEAVQNVESNLNQIVASAGRFMGIPEEQTRTIKPNNSGAHDWLSSHFPGHNAGDPKSVVVIRALYTEREDGFQPEELMLVMESLDDLAFLAQAVTIER